LRGEFILLDLYETLVGFDRQPIEDGLASMAGLAGVSPEDLARAERATLRDRMRGCFGTTVEDEYAQILREAGADPGLAPTFVEGAFEAWRRAAYLFADVPDALRRLGTAGVRLGLISNCSRLTRPLLDGPWDLGRYFERDAVILSCEIGSLKPERAIFDLSLERIGGTPGAGMLVDDRRQYVDAARALGLDARRIARAPAARSDDPVEIGDLRELADEVLADDRPSVAVAYIVENGRLLMLRRRRRLGTLEWAGPSGEIEAGETAEEAAVREVREELGLDVVVERRLGEHVHPSTDRHLVYCVCRVVSGTPEVIDHEEIAAMQWCELPVVLEHWAGLKGGIFPPVREYLERSLIS
jgi:8-oxo-dGTP diphosphatase